MDAATQQSLSELVRLTRENGKKLDEILAEIKYSNHLLEPPNDHHIDPTARAVYPEHIGQGHPFPLPLPIPRSKP